MNWFEKLPPNCPPSEAFPPESSFFRLGIIPPDDSDFWSHRRRFPHRVAELISVAFSGQGILILTKAGVPHLSHS